MAHGHTINVYVNGDRLPTLHKVDRVKADTRPRTSVIFEALELWLEVQEDGHEDAERP